MITVFPSTLSPQDWPKEPRRRSVVSRACAECQRRKVKCDGHLPCSNCRIGQVSCQYRERRRQDTHQRGQYEARGDTKGYEAIVTRLFGQSLSISSLRGYSRDELLELLLRADGSRPHDHGVSSVMMGPTSGVPVSLKDVSGAIQRLQKLEDGPSEGFEWNESSVSPQDEGMDDVNSLSLDARPPSSFLGIFSVAAVVRVLVDVLPGFNALQPANNAEPRQSDAVSTTAGVNSPQSPSVAPQIQYHDGQRLIDAYFSNVHVFAPMIHEPTFRTQFLMQSRKDSAWLSLFYMVLALGSVTTSSWSDSRDDIVYYRAAQAHLGLESFGSGHIETLQALILIGGLYLHYRNKPNMASAIMGAANRMASGLGLHREAHDQTSQSQRETETRRRTWWSLYVLDSWGSITLGRPNHSIMYNAKVPRNLIDDQNGEAAANEPTLHSPLIHSIELCKMLGRIQSRLQIGPILNPAEISTHDKLLVGWFENLPPFMHSSNVCPEPLRVIRSVLKWRYQSIRILLYRAVMLDATMRQIPYTSLGEEEQKLMAQCRRLAADSISCIRLEWRPTKMSGWNAVWFLFQACLIPLMALATEPAGGEEHPKWRELVKVGITLCGDMSSWSRVGAKTKQALEQLLRATERSCMIEQVGNEAEVLGEFSKSLTPFLFEGEWYDVMGQDDVPVPFDQSLGDYDLVNNLSRYSAPNI